MSNLQYFLKENKVKKENEFYPATKSLRDENGKPVEWEIRALSTKEYDEIREECTKEVNIGKNRRMPKVDTSMLILRMMTASIVSPNLRLAELQDSYGVKTAEDLLQEMVSDPGEYTKFAEFIQRLCGFTIDVEEDIEEAKN